MKVLPIVLMYVALAILLSVILAWPVMMLWNYCLAVAISGVHTITWLQAWGITILANVLFKTTATTKSD